MNETTTTERNARVYPYSVQLSLLFPQIVPERIMTKSSLKHAMIALEGGFPLRDYLLAKLELIIRSLAIELIIPPARIFPNIFVLILFSHQFNLACESSRGALLYRIILSRYIYHIGSEKKKTFKNFLCLIEKNMVNFFWIHYVSNYAFQFLLQNSMEKST